MAARRLHAHQDHTLLKAQPYAQLVHLALNVQVLLKVQKCEALALIEQELGRPLAPHELQADFEQDQPTPGQFVQQAHTL